MFAEQLRKVSVEYELQVLLFVLMDNHFHMLAKTPQANLSAALNYLLREVSRKISRASGRINHVFGGENHQSVITNERYFRNAYRYVYRNPADAGLCDRVENYRYSTLFYRHRGLDAGFPFLDGDPVQESLPQEGPNRLEWLNNPYADGVRDVVRKALRRPEFQFSKRRNEARFVREAERE